MIPRNDQKFPSAALGQARRMTLLDLKHLPISFTLQNKTDSNFELLVHEFVVVLEVSFRVVR